MANNDFRIRPPQKDRVIPVPHAKGVPSPKISQPNFQEMHVAFCFRDIDQEQGATLHAWEEKSLLPKMVHKIAEVSRMTIQEATQSKAIKAYHRFPERSRFVHPNHVTQDAEWAALHIQGKEVLGGHIERNIFHVVFLDSEHGFYVSNFKDRNPQRKSQKK